VSRQPAKARGRRVPRVLIPLLLVGAIVLGAAWHDNEGSAIAAAGPAPKQARPNVIVIETDDQTAETLRVMKNVKALLGAQGATFENNFVTFPLCCPSRATLLTGQYAHNHGVLGNSPPAGGYEKLDHSNTLAVWLQRAGYHTAHLGKYLNGYGKRGKELEIPPGWSEWHGAVKLTFFDHQLNVNGKLVSFGSRPADYQTDVYGAKAREIIKRRAPGTKPFFLWLAFFAPHGGGPPDADDPKGMGTTKPAPRHQNDFATEPLPAPPSLNERDVSDKPAGIRSRPLLSAQDLAAVREAYQQQLESLLAVDEAVAGVVAQLKQAGELSNTLIVFTADNGFFHGEHRVPSGKVLLYEPSIRVPLLMRGPGVPKGVRVQQLVANIDLAPTIVDAANAKPGRAMDGRSLLPLVKNRQLPWRNELLLERGPAGGGKKAGKKGNGPRQNARDQRYAAIRTARYLYAEYESGERELYDLAQDPHELTSRHADPSLAPIRTDLSQRLARLSSCAGQSCR